MNNHLYFGEWVWTHRDGEPQPARVVWFRDIIICSACGTDCGDEPRVFLQFADGTEIEEVYNHYYRPERLNSLELLALEV